MMVWNLVMAYWADRVEPGRKVLSLYVGAALLAVAWVSSIRLKGTTVFGLLLLACWLTRLGSAVQAAPGSGELLHR